MSAVGVPHNCGKKDVLAIVCKLDDEQMMQAGAILKICNAEDLTPLEEAQAIAT